MYYWIAVGKYHEIISKSGYESYWDAEVAMCDFIDNCDFEIMNCIVKKG